MKRVAVAAVILVFAAIASQVQAADAPDPTGTWKWTVMFNDQSREMTLKLKLEGDKLSGSMLGRNNQETPIENAKYENGEVSFAVTRERQGQKFTTKYKGKVEGETIKGTQEFERDGQTRSREWEAKKAAA
jgi:hypothetical protein